MKNLFGTLTILVLTLSAAAFEDLGPLTEARQKHPELFVPGRVLVTDIKGVPCYVFSGEAEQAFTGAFAEAESELYEEATLSAKTKFYEFFAKGDKKTTVNMSGCGVLYQYNNKKVYTVILFVPKANVIVKKPVAPAPAAKPAKPAAPPESKPAPAPAAKPVTPAAPPESKPAPAPAVKPVTPAATPESKPAPAPFERRVVKLNKRLEKNPDDVISRIALGDLYNSNNYPEKAAAQYEKAVVRLNDSRFFDQEEKNRVISTLAALYESIGKYNLALKYYHLLLKQRCSQSQRQNAVNAISRLRMKMMD